MFWILIEIDLHSWWCRLVLTTFYSNQFSFVYLDQLSNLQFYFCSWHVIVVTTEQEIFVSGLRLICIIYCWCWWVFQVLRRVPLKLLNHAVAGWWHGNLSAGPQGLRFERPKKLKRKPAGPPRSSPKRACSRPQWPNLLSMWPWRRWSTKPCMHIQDQASFQFTLSPASWGRWSTEKLKEIINWHLLNKRILFSLINWKH